MGEGSGSTGENLNHSKRSVSIPVDVDFLLFEYSDEDKRFAARHQELYHLRGAFKDFTGDYESFKAKQRQSEHTTLF